MSVPFIRGAQFLSLWGYEISPPQLQKHYIAQYTLSPVRHQKSWRTVKRIMPTISRWRPPQLRLKTNNLLTATLSA